MTTDRTVFMVIFCLAVKAEIGKHIYVPHAENWANAQAYCRNVYTDLSFVNDQKDMDKLVNAGNREKAWIGLYRHSGTSSLWMWSGGGQATYQNWKSSQPNNAYQNQNYAVITFPSEQWNDVSGGQSCPFYCINVTVVKEKKSWEEALKYCRERQTDLPSVVSETDRLVAQSEIIQHHDITFQVWIGLRYLDGYWLWVNNDTLEYEAWPQNQEPLCPVWEHCGSLNKGGEWQAMDCEEKLNFICI